jgi:hypothetical protein
MQLLLTNVNGESFAIRSKDPITIARWLGEVITTIAPGLAEYHLDGRVQIYKEYSMEEEWPEWSPVGGMGKSVTGEQLESLKNILQEFFNSLD